MNQKPLNRIKDSTVIAYAISKAFSVPFWGLFCLLIFILEKDLHATPLQLATFIAIRPVSGIFSAYWSQMACIFRKRLIPNLFLGNLLKFTPFLFFPWVNNPWFYIFSAGLHMALCRGTIPPWMEVLKLKMDHPSRTKVFAIGGIIESAGLTILPLFFGKFLNVPEAWRWLFPLSALLGMAASWPIKRIELPDCIEENVDLQKNPLFYLAAPWKKGWDLLNARVDFFTFQWAAFLGGAGLIICHSVLPRYFNHVLNLSYSDLLIAISALKGVGFCVSSLFWVKFFNPSKIFLLSSIAAFLAGLFPLMILSAHASSCMIYVAYLTYGIMQAGSELACKMSGPIFAGEENSTPFTSIHVLAIGIRGLIFPYLGTLLFVHSQSPTLVLLFAMTLSLWATGLFFISSKKYPIWLNTDF